MVLRPLAELFAVNDPGEAINVNALDEVPNSSWFTNRIGYFPRTTEEVARGACSGNIDTAGPWTVVEAKPNGFNPGFFIKTASGQRYLLKADGIVQPERNTAADVIGSKLFYAAGFDTRATRSPTSTPSILKVDPEAVAEDEYGEDPPAHPGRPRLCPRGLHQDQGRPHPRGLQRVREGQAAGPLPLRGRARDDPNDVVPHADHRELRGPRSWPPGWATSTPASRTLSTCGPSATAASSCSTTTSTSAPRSAAAGPSTR
jgi:hypothetical protein